MAFDFVFRFRHGTQKVRIGLVRTPLPDEIIVTVMRVRDAGLSLSAEIEFDAERRLLSDTNGSRVVAAGVDFWRALDASLGGLDAPGRSETLRRAGYEWGLSHALRVEAVVQNQLQLALRETELHVALEYLAGSLGVLGMGRFEIDLSYRRRGLMIVTHYDSPVITAEAGERPCCALLEGLHAGLLSHLAGRRLSAREVTCSRAASDPCRFAVATESRLVNLLDPSAGSADADLILSLGARPPENG